MAQIDLNYRVLNIRVKMPVFFIISYNSDTVPVRNHPQYIIGYTELLP